jgi:hypothetical protein
MLPITQGVWSENHENSRLTSHNNRCFISKALLAWRPIPSGIAGNDVSGILGGKVNRAEFNREKKLMDVGTRYQHMSELCELWDEMAHLTLTRSGYITKDDNEKAATMTAMADQVRLVMTGLSDYNDEVNSIRWMVDMLNDVKSEDIHGGRGSELDGWEPGKPATWGT